MLSRHGLNTGDGAIAEKRNNSVVVTKGGDPAANTLEALERLELPSFAGQKVLLKPNLGRCADPGQGVTTHPAVILAAIRFFASRDAREVWVGDSPITGVQAADAFRAAGLDGPAQEAGATFVDLDAEKPVNVAVPDGTVIQKVGVCAPVLAADYVVSLPVMKTHMHTVVSLAGKNMKGALWRKEKVKFHQVEAPEEVKRGEKTLDIAIADLLTAVRPDLALIDGTVGMEGLGPSAGEPKPAHLIVAGTDFVAADATAARLMGFEPESIPHLRMAAERGVGALRSEQIDVSPADYLSFRTPFSPPPKDISIQMPNVVVHENGACSACVSTVLMFLKGYESELADYFLEDGRFHLAMGRGVDHLPDGSLLVGNCTARHRERGILVRGCPPVPSQMVAALRRR